MAFASSSSYLETVIILVLMSPTAPRHIWATFTKTNDTGSIAPKAILSIPPVLLKTIAHIIHVLAHIL
jgi:hypothetical protein